MERVHVVRLLRENALVTAYRFVMKPGGEAGVGTRGEHADIVGKVGVEWKFGFVHRRRWVA